jgi:hypothetical protein
MIFDYKWNCNNKVYKSLAKKYLDKKKKFDLDKNFNFKKSIFLFLIKFILGLT